MKPATTFPYVGGFFDLSTKLRFIGSNTEKRAMAVGYKNVFFKMSFKNVIT